MIKAYMKGIVRLEGKGRQGVGVELFRADAIEDEDIDLTESESESIGEVNESVAIMRVYEEIGEDFWTGKGITAKKFAKELDKLGSVRELNVHINCLGGDCFTAQTIHNIIRDFGCEKKTSYIDGVCASAATVIACASDEVIARNNTTYMVHLPWAICMGNAPAMRKAADQLDILTTPIVNVYKAQVKGRIREAKIKTLMEEETWMTASEALDYGFVDKVKGSIKAIARAGSYLLANGKHLDVSKYHYMNVPEYPLVETRKENSMEKVEAKVSNPITKEMLAKEYPDILAQIKDEARNSERKRLAALDEMKIEESSPELEALIEAAKADGRQPSEIAMECYNLAKEQVISTSMVGAMTREGSMHIKAGDAPMNKVEGNDKKAVSLLAEAFANHSGRKTK